MSVVFGIVGVLILAIAYVVYNKLQIEKAKAAQILALNDSVRQIQDKYKSLVSQLQIDGVIDTEARRKLIMVANNYFVFQPVNAINISHLSDLTDVFINAVNTATSTEGLSEETFTEILATLANALPDNTREFTAPYYLNVAPGLFYDFSTAVEASLSNAATTAADELGEELIEPELEIATAESEQNQKQA